MKNDSMRITQIFYKEKKRKRENRKRESFLQRVKEKTEKERLFYKE